MNYQKLLACPILLTYLAACGGSGSTSLNPVTGAEIVETFDQVANLAANDFEERILSAPEIAANGSATYQGVAGFGTGADDDGGILGRLSMQVEFSDRPTVSGSADGFIAFSRDELRELSNDPDTADLALTGVDGSVSFSNGSIVTVGGISALAFDIDGTVDVPSEAGLAIGTGSLTIDGRTAAVVTEDAIISDFGEVSGSLDGEDVVVGFSVYGFEE